MKKVLDILLKNNVVKFCLLLLLIFFIYFLRWIYVINIVPNDLIQQYNQSSLLNISDRQYKIIWFAITKNKNYGFNRYPFFIDNFFRNNKENLDYEISSYLIIANEQYKNYHISKKRNIQNGLSRYINKDNNFKKCLSIFISQGNFGENIYNMEEACKIYYDKSIKDISDEECLSLVGFAIYPHYTIGSRESEKIIKEILYNFDN